MLEVIDRTGGKPIPYREAWDWQLELVAQRQREEIPDKLLLLTHPPTVTYGKRADPAFRLLTEEGYAERDIELVPTDRGGDVTYHGPGQLVGYPIVSMGEGRRDLHRYVRLLEQTLIDACAELGVSHAGRVDYHAGVWVDDGYLAALGVRVSRWVTYHGFALNVSDQVRTNFGTIVPCGVPDHDIVTMEQLLKRPVTVAEVAPVVARHFHRLWETTWNGKLP